jgi:hypothetical protein
MTPTKVVRVETQKLVRRDAAGYERIVMAELLIPNVANVFGDIYTDEAIREFVEEFARQGHGLDIQHDEVDVDGEKLLMVESFIARPGDPDFIEGSWVVGLKILDDATWEKVVSGELNGFSFQAECLMTEIEVETLTPREVSGVTEPYLPDGHTHTYMVLLDTLNNVIAGGTGVTDGHSHTISRHSVTKEAEGHTHRFQVIVTQEQDNG